MMHIYIALYLAISSRVLGIQASNVPASVVDQINDFVSGLEYAVSNVYATRETCIDAGNQDTIADLIIANSKFPSISLFSKEENPVLTLADDPPIPINRFDAFHDLLDGLAMVDSCVAKITWDSPSTGIFDTYGIYTADGTITYETMDFFLSSRAALTRINDSSQSPIKSPASIGLVRRELDDKLDKCEDYEVSDKNEGEGDTDEIQPDGVVGYLCGATAQCRGKNMVQGSCLPFSSSVPNVPTFFVPNPPVIQGNCCEVTCEFRPPDKAVFRRSVEVCCDGDCMMC